MEHITNHPTLLCILVFIKHHPFISYILVTGVLGVIFNEMCKNSPKDTDVWKGGAGRN